MSKPRWDLPNLSGEARAMRHVGTQAEKLLWQHLRNRQLGAKFRRQVQIGPYIADFLCHEARLIVELDGGQHDAQMTQDEQRTRRLNDEGFHVLRFWNSQVLENPEAVLAEIQLRLRQLLSPSPGR